MINIKRIQCIYIQNHDMPKQTLTRVYGKVMWIKFQYLSLRYFALLYSVLYPHYITPYRAIVNNCNISSPEKY